MMRSILNSTAGLTKSEGRRETGWELDTDEDFLNDPCNDLCSKSIYN